MTRANSERILGPASELHVQDFQGAMVVCVWTAKEAGGQFLEFYRLWEFPPRDPWKAIVDAVYRSRCRRVYNRQKGLCVSCGRSRPLQFHHIRPRGRHGRDDSLENLEGRCVTCHEKVERRKGMIPSAKVADRAKASTEGSE